MSRLALLPLRGQLGSYCFSYVGDSAYTASEFMGAEVRNLYHMPRVPVPPGVGFFFSRFHGKLNAVFSYPAGALSDADADAVMRDARARLLVGVGKG